MFEKKGKLIVNAIAEDIGLRVPVTGPCYYENKNFDLICDYNEENDTFTYLEARLEQKDFSGFNVCLYNDELGFHCVKDYNVYTIRIKDDHFSVITSKDHFGKSSVKSFYFLNNDNHSELSVSETYLDEDRDCDFVGIERDADKTRMITSDGVYESKTDLDENQVQNFMKELLRVAEDDIKNAFDVINSSIPNFFNIVKYDFPVLTDFINQMYDDNELTVTRLAEEVMTARIH